MIAIAFSLGLISPSSFAQTSFPIDRLIEGMGSPEATVRQESTLELANLGPLARTLLREAASDPRPEVAGRARELLARLPVHQADDPPEVKACLFDYVSEEQSNRSRRIQRLGRLGTGDAARALLRLTRDEPAPLLRWQAAAQLIHCSSEPLAVEIRDSSPDSRDPVQLALAGWAWRSTDLAKAQAYLVRAMAVDPGMVASSTEPAAVLVPILKQVQLLPQARELFDTSFRHQDPDSSLATPESLSQLALFCLRCDERLPEALALATRAAASEPNNPAFLDTLARVHFRLGHAKEAVRLAERALQQCPTDEFIEQQLERFLAAVE